MKSIIKKALAVVLMVPVIALGVSVIGDTSAFAQLGTGANVGQNASTATSLNDTFKNVINILLYIIGAASVIMLIVGGIRYTISAGDSGQVTSAKNTIMYAIVGLVLAFLAYAIVNFVLTGLSSGDASSA